MWISLKLLTIKVRSRKWTWCFYGVVEKENCCRSPFLLPRCVGYEGTWEWINDDDVCKDGEWCCGHHEKLKEVGNDGGWIIMKKQAPQDIVQSTYVMGIGGKICKWWRWQLLKGRHSLCMMVGGKWRRQEDRYLNWLLE